MGNNNLENIANILQIASFYLNVAQTSNDELMKALEIQNEKYLELCIQQNKEIIERLERLENGNIKRA